MLEIFVIVYLIISVPATILFLMAFAIARRADHRLERTDKIYPDQQPSEEKIHFKRSISSVDF